MISPIERGFITSAVSVACFHTMYFMIYCIMRSAQIIEKVYYLELWIMLGILRRHNALQNQRSLLEKPFVTGITPYYRSASGWSRVFGQGSLHPPQSNDPSPCTTCRIHERHIRQFFPCRSGRPLGSRPIQSRPGGYLGSADAVSVGAINWVDVYEDHDFPDNMAQPNDRIPGNCAGSRL